MAQERAYHPRLSQARTREGITSVKYQVCRPLTPIEYELLKADIAEHGVLVPIEQDEDGEILDGHHRARAWQELTAEGVTLADAPVIVRSGLSEEDKRNHARRLNALRRQLSDDERERLMVEMRQDGASYRQIATANGVSTMTAYNAVKNSGVQNYTPETINGSDGKQYPATKVKTEYWSPAPAFDYEEQAEELAEDETAYDWSEDDLDVDDEPDLPVTLLVAPAIPVEDIPAEYDSDEWYTPIEFIEAAREVMGGISLDPASSHEAQNVIGATVYYTLEDDGLEQEWVGRNVWLNPPYSAPRPWVEKLIESLEAGSVESAILLVNTANSPQWARPLWHGPYVVCLLDRRVRFWRPDRPDAKGFDRDQMIWYLGSDVAKFRAVFGPYGAIR